VHNLLLNPFPDLDVSVNGRAGVLPRQFRSAPEVGVVVVRLVILYHVVQIRFAVAFVAQLAVMVLVLISLRPLDGVVFLLAGSPLQRFLLPPHALLFIVDVQEGRKVYQYKHHEEDNHHHQRRRAFKRVSLHRGPLPGVSIRRNRD